MQFYPTFDVDSIRAFMLACSVLLPTSSWARQPRKTNGALVVPCLPVQVPEIAADSGGFMASVRAKKLGLAILPRPSAQEVGCLPARALGPFGCWPRWAHRRHRE